MGETTSFRIFHKTVPVVFEEILHSKSIWISSQERPSEVGELLPQENPLIGSPLETEYAER